MKNNLGLIAGNRFSIPIRTEPVERGDTRFFTSAASDGIEN